jgi:hypothetical protein
MVCLLRALSRLVLIRLGFISLSQPAVITLEGCDRHGNLLNSLDLEIFANLLCGEGMARDVQQLLCSQFLE